MLDCVPVVDAATHATAYPVVTLRELPCRLYAVTLDCAPVVDAAVYPLDPAAYPIATHLSQGLRDWNK